MAGPAVPESNVSDDRVRVRMGANGAATVTMVRADKHNALDQRRAPGFSPPGGFTLWLGKWGRQRRLGHGLTRQDRAMPSVTNG
jgi:hypothetical protein